MIQTYKSTIEQQSNQIKSLEEKLSELETSLQALVNIYINASSFFMLNILIHLCREQMMNQLSVN